MEGFTPWIGEIIVGVVLAIFGLAFRSWSMRLSDGIKKLDQIERVLLTKLEALSAEFHEHTIRTEARVTRVETKVDILVQNGRNKREDRNNPT